ncbi:DUF1905 domain-containing protein [Arthrobacter sp. NEB 688]|uniref:DUF1905 domain-containing protein n=1 Tax=Arthrobacter sp. NEB 688 TaxID=904039 RepID=UPI00336C2808
MVTDRAWTFEATLWRDGGWRFVTVPAQASDEVDAVVGDATGGFGSVRVRVQVGATTWLTSVFPSTAHAAYVLPVKKAVRAAEALDEGDTVRVVLRLEGR